jgi:membrane protein
MFFLKRVKPRRYVLSKRLLRLHKTSSFVLQLLKQTFKKLQENDPIRMAGATAFFTFFALPPIVIIISNVLSLVLNDHYRRISSQLFDKLGDLLGHPSANQLEAISQSIHRRPTPNFLLTLLSIALLLLASTTLFAVIKNSLNQIWQVKAKPERRLVHVLVDKSVALAIIIGSGLLFTISLTLEQVMAQVRDNLVLPSFSYYNQLALISHFLVSVLIRMIWFAMLFRYLPDIRIHWKAIWPGALVTSILYKLGEWILDNLLINSPVSSLYGASGALILILLFVFYSALIFYFGAAFTEEYGQRTNLTAEPARNALAYTITELDTPQTEAKDKQH